MGDWLTKRWLRQLGFTCLGLAWGIVVLRGARAESGGASNGFALALDAGWNLVALGRSASHPTGSDGMRLTVMRVTDALSGPPGAVSVDSNSASRLRSGEAYWIYTREPLVWEPDLGPFEWSQTASVSSRSALDHWTPASVDPTQTSSEALDMGAGSYGADSLGWQVAGVAMSRVYGGAAGHQVLRWDSSSGAFVQVRVGDVLAPGVGYWVRGAAETAAGPKPVPPGQISGVRMGDSVRLHWLATEGFEDGRLLPNGVHPVYRVYRRTGIEGSFSFVQSTEQTTWTDEFLPETAHVVYYVQAVVQSGQVEWVSGRSLLLPFDLDAEPAVVAPGAFEAPSMVPARDTRMALPKVAITRFRNQVVAHLVYIAPGAAEGGDQLRYLKSTRAGQAGSWTSPMPLVPPHPGWRITDLALAARGARVSVAWISEGVGGLEGQSRVHVLEDHEGGAWSSAKVGERMVRHNHQWKRGLGLAYDRFMHHHLMWGEANKVFYLRNFEGERDARGNLVNVFDEEKRWVNRAQVRYAEVHAQAACDDGQDCCEVREDKAYSLALEVDGHIPCAAEESGCALVGPYLHRVEEAYVESPFLHVDDERISIIARQTRMFDNFSYPNPDWRGLKEPFFGPMVPSPAPNPGGSPEWCAQGGFLFQQGFRHAWKANQYACSRPIPSDAVDLMRFDVQPMHTQGWARNDFYAYDGRRGHTRDWYQYTFHGRWHEEDVIKVAQRPIVAGAWSKTKMLRRPVAQVVGEAVELVEVDEEVESGFRQGAWKRSPPHAVFGSQENTDFEETRLRWRMSDVHRFDAVREHEIQGCEDLPSHQARGEAAPAHAMVYSSPEGGLTAVYEKGPEQDRDRGRDPALLQSFSTDGGRHWSPPVLLGAGHRPVGGTTASGRSGVLYRVSPAPSEQSRAALASVQFGWNALEGPLVSMGWKKEMSSVRPSSVPVLTSFEDLLIAAWVRPGRRPLESDAIVLTRAREGNDVRQLALLFDDSPSAGHQTASVVVQMEDKFHFRVDEAHTVEFFSPGPWALDDSGSRAEVHLVEGVASLQLSAAAAQSIAGSAFEPTIRVQLKGAESAPIEAEWDASTIARNVGGHYALAKTLRDLQVRKEASGEGDSAERVYQVEYLPDPSVDVGDTRYLSEAERTWVYTQGIALAQRARGDDPEDATLARGMARWLCDYAERGTPESSVPSSLGLGQPKVIKGWHFSRNTKGDDWKDARLVTGASAWAIHGLGIWIVSPAFAELPVLEQRTIVACYHQALAGLFEHRRVLSDTLSLMTAGWTTLGLAHAATPHRLDPSMPAFPAGREETWAYYDVLEAIGYDRFVDDEAKRSTIRAYLPDRSLEDSGAQTAGRLIVVTETDWNVLKQRVKAQNVVTEHNLDVLAVLNHALAYPVRLGPEEQDRRAIWIAELASWKESLRRGIFELLWDEKDWQKDLDDTHAHLKGEDLGRFVTGGRLDFADGVLSSAHFSPSSHVAIDNCSWLALSVDYETLERVDREKLAKCLRYTIAVFAKELSFEDKTYYGTHYFKNDFKDPYIDESPLQEKSYHLEATAGLVLGLHVFADAYPEHARVPLFQQEARALWAGMQEYVYEWGFPYSSQRIQDLSTRLSSSTAVIWFMDVHDYLEDSDHSKPVEVRYEDIAGALFELGNLMQRPESAMLEREAVNHFALRLLMARGKLVSKFGTRVVTMVDDVLKLPPGLASAAVVGVNAAAYLGGTGSVDLGLETLLAGSGAPPFEYWEEKGLVLAETVVVQPAAGYFRSEAEIRNGVAIYPKGPDLSNPLKNPPAFFDSERIYFIDMEWFGLDTPAGKIGVLTPGNGAFWSVYELKSDRSRFEVMEDFIRNHALFKKLAPHAERLPDPLQVAWLYLLELAIRSDFDRPAAERYVRGAQASSGENAEDGPKVAHGPHAPFFTKDGEWSDPSIMPGIAPNQGHDAAAAALLPLSTGKTVYRGLPFEAYKKGVKDAPELVYWVLPRGHDLQGTMASYEPLLASEDPRFNEGQDPQLQDALVDGKAWVITVVAPPGSIRVASAYEEMGFFPPPGTESGVVIPFLLNLQVWSRHQVDRAGNVIPGTVLLNKHFSPTAKAPNQLRSETWVDETPLSDVDLQTQVDRIHRIQKGTQEGSPEYKTAKWTPAELDAARTSAPTVLVSARLGSPHGASGLFTNQMRPGTSFDDFSNRSKGNAYIYATTLTESADFYLPLAGSMETQYPRIREEYWERSEGEVLPDRLEDHDLINVAWIYYIENDGRALNFGLKKNSGNGEYAFPEYVSPEQVIGAKEYRWDTDKMETWESAFIPNPHYKGRYASLEPEVQAPVEEAKNPAAVWALEHGVSWDDPLMQDLKWASWLLDVDVDRDEEVPDVPGGHEAYRAFQVHLENEGQNVLPMLVPGRLNGSSKLSVMPAMPHHPRNQLFFREFANKLFKNTFLASEGWGDPEERMVDVWHPPSGPPIVLHYQIRVEHKDGRVVVGDWDPAVAHPNRVREQSHFLVKLMNDGAKTALGSSYNGIAFTDIIEVHHFNSVARFFEERGPQDIARIYDGQKLEETKDYPPGVVEVPISEIGRVVWTEAGGTDWDRDIFGLAKSLRDNGFYLMGPIEVKQHPDGTLSLLHDGHHTLAVLNGLGAKTAPVVFADKVTGRILEGPNSAPAWVESHVLGTSQILPKSGSPGERVPEDVSKELALLKGGATLSPLAFMDKIGYTFSDPSLLLKAITVPAFKENPDFQRFEFGGDAVVGLAATWGLATHRPWGHPEEKIGAIRSDLVSTSFLAAAASAIGLDRVLRAGDTELRDQEALLEEAFEAFAWALHQDASPETTLNILWHALETALPKQEPRWEVVAGWSLKTHNAFPDVEVTLTKRTDYKAQVGLGDEVWGTARGPTHEKAVSNALTKAIDQNKELGRLWKQRTIHTTAPLPRPVLFPPRSGWHPSKEAHMVLDRLRRDFDAPDTVAYALSFKVGLEYVALLEFLGRPIFKLLFAELAIKQFPHAREAELTQWMSKTRPSIKRIAEALGLSALVQTFPKGQSNLLTLNRIVGALFWQYGLPLIKRSFAPHMWFSGTKAPDTQVLPSSVGPSSPASSPKPKPLPEEKPGSDEKSLTSLKSSSAKDKLTEWSQNKWGVAPKYETSPFGGQYMCEVRASGQILGRGFGDTPKKAEASAIKDALTQNRIR